ncbi:MAG: hypothetical protein ACRDHW_11070 [Ktedonobacteraceae bacterium]
MSLMGCIYSFNAWNLVSSAPGLSQANGRELVRMSVNSLAWTVAGVAVVSIMA